MSCAVCCIVVGSLLVYSPVVDRASAYTPHDAIYISADSEFTSDNGVVSGSGTEGDPFMISGWNITDPGVAIEVTNTTAHFAISDCHIHDSGDYAVFLLNAQNATVTGCNLSLNRYGIMVDSCRNVTISLNSIWSNVLDGLFVIDSHDVRVLDNALDFNGDDGVFETGGSGVFEIIGNSIANNGDSGVLIWHGAEITGNTIANNDWFGIGLNASGSVIYHNNIINNKIQAYEDSPIANAWDNGYPEGGNYWGDYAGVDVMSGVSQNISGSDGIGDSPRVVPMGREDRYPLMQPLESNRPPVASFEIAPLNGDTSTLFEFNASSSWDYETPADELLFRWDWEDDGIWDTGWSTDSNATHQFSAPGAYSVRLEVMDGNGTAADHALQVEVTEVIPELPAMAMPVIAAALCMLVFALGSAARRRHG